MRPAPHLSFSPAVWRGLGLALGLTVLPLAAACSGGDSPTGPRAANEVDEAGGTVQAQGGQVSLVFPPGAVTGTIEVTVEPAEEPPADPGLLEGAAFDFGPDGTQFSEPVELTIEYDSSQLPEGTAEGSLAIFKAVGDGWQRVEGSVVSEGADEVTASITSFSVYAVVSDDPCLRVESIAFGETVSGDLSADDCRISSGRLVDKFGFAVESQTAFSATVTSDDFTGAVFTEQITDGDGRILMGRVGSSHHIVAPGTYALWPTSLETEEGGVLVTGSYSVTAEAIPGDPTGGCGPNVTVTHGVSVEASITSDDCEDEFDNEPDVIRWVDDYELAVGPGETATVTMTADFQFNLTTWTGGTFLEGEFSNAPGTTATLTVSPNEYTYFLFAAISDTHEGTGDYTISFDIAGGGS